MTILLLGTNITTGGAQRVLLDLAQAFNARQVSVSTAFFYDKDGLLPVWKTQYSFPIECFDAWKQGDRNILRIFRLIKAWLQLIKWMRKNNFSSILTFTHDSNILGLAAACLAGVPIRYGSHHVRYPSLSKAKMQLHRWLINSRTASGLFAVSSFTHNQAIEEGIKPEKIKVIYNGMTLPELRPAQLTAVKQEIRRFGGGPIILNVGRLVPQKGQDLFIKAAPVIRAQIPNAICLIAGDGELRDDLQSLIDREGLTEHVYLLGNRTDVPELLAAADVFVLSSRYEGLPMTLLEAMSSETPVVSTEIEGVADVIRHEQTGLLVNPENPTAIADAVIRLLNDQPLRMHLAKNAKELVEKEFSLAAMAENYLKILEAKHES